jgi:acyl dehydratase
MRVFPSLEAFAAAAGEHLGYSDWHTVTQEQIDTFADASGDRQWIHLDVEKAARGPFGTTIAHGFLTLSLISMLSQQTYRVDGLSMAINYGLNKVRFPRPVKVGARIRGGGELTEVTEVPGGRQAVVHWTIEIDGEDKPACVADFVSRLMA